MAFLAVDLGGSHAGCALLQEGEVSLFQELALAPGEPFDHVLASVTAALVTCAQSSRTPLEGIGIGFCGLVDARTNRVTSTNGKYEEALGFDFEPWGQREFRLPVRLENDARLALRGEMATGAARDSQDVVMFTLGTGIGGVAAMNGNPLAGAHGQAGVLAGHIPVRPNGHLCTCGAHGCAESEASGWALPEICRQWPHFEDSLLAHGDLNFRSLFSAAAQRDAIAIQIRDHCLEIWGMMTVAAVHSFDPELVIFGGGVMGSAAQILPFLRQYVHANAWTPWGKVRVEAASLGNHAALLGVPGLFKKEH